MKVSRVSEMRAMDRSAIEQLGISAELLMENAGHAVYFALRNEFGVLDKRFLIFCGLGNNGGDGMVLARKIHTNGGDVQVVLLANPDKYQEPARTKFEIISRLPIQIWKLEEIGAVREIISDCDVIVDAIFGTGLSREVKGHYREVIELINASSKPILSIDIPSGVHGDTGKVMGVAVKADITVTLGLPKLGNMLYPGYKLGGKLFVSHISFPPSLHQSDSFKVLINQPIGLPSRNDAEHKGSFGKLLTIGGTSSNWEAPYFSALSFLNSGGGYSRLAIPKSISTYIANRCSEIILVPQEESASGSISIPNLDSLLQLIEDTDIVVLGPGLSLQEETQGIICELVMEISKPLLINGDGITALCADLDLLQNRKGVTVLISYLEEMARITSKPMKEIDERKVDIVQEAAKSLNAIIVLKGAHSLIGYPDQRVFINMSGNAGMATAGLSDGVTGTIAAMYCLGLPPEEAVRQGVFVHGLASDLAANAKGEKSFYAQDVVDHLPLAVKECRKGLSKEFLDRYAGPHLI